MNLRHPPAIVAGIASALLIPAAASAAQLEVTAQPDATFSPAKVTIRPGDSVIFRNAGGGHNVRFEDGEFTQPAFPSFLPWQAGPRTFPATGRFRYVCDLHRAIGMTGEVDVVAPGTALPDDVRPRVTHPALKARSRKLTLTFRTNEAGRASVKFTRGRSTIRRLTKNVKRGRATVRLGRRLAPGRYGAAITVKDKAGNRSRTVKAGVRIR